MTKIRYPQMTNRKRIREPLDQVKIGIREGNAVLRAMVLELGNE